MKKITLWFFAAFMLLTVSPLTVQASVAATPVPLTETTIPATTSPDPTQQRILEIQAMDKSKLTRQERKALRKELRSLKKGGDGVGGGVYISGGLLVVIIILLIIFL